MRIMKINKKKEIIMIIMKTNKIIEIHVRVMKILKILKNPFEKIWKSLKSWKYNENQANYEKLKNPYQNHENHEILKYP